MPQLLRKSLTISVFSESNGVATREITGVPWYPGITVLDALILADAMYDDTFTFRVIYGSNFGAFIDRIDKIEDSNEQYWIVYVDGKQSEFGVSETLIEQPQSEVSKIDFRFETLPTQSIILKKRKLATGGN